MPIEANLQEEPSRARNIRDAVLVYLLLFTSGTVVYIAASDKYLILVFLLALGAWFLFTDKTFSTRFALYLVTFTSFLFVIHLYTGGSLPITLVIGATMKLLLAYLVLVIVGDNFIESFIKTVVLLAAVSLFGFITDIFDLFDGVIRHLPRVEDRNGYEGFLYIYRGMGSSMGRNSSIFYEPGAYQAFLNTALFMLLFARTKLGVCRRWVYMSILLVALLTTVSTTGALIFGALFGLALIKSTIVSSNAKMLLVGALVIVITMFSEKFYYVIFDKIERYATIEDVTDSDERRSFGLLVDIEIFKRHIFGAGNRLYFKEFSQIGLIYEGETSSNGISSTFAIFGFPFALFYFGSFFTFFYKYFSGVVMKAVPLFMLLIFLISEGHYAFTPFSMMLIAAVFVFEKKETGESTEAIR